MPYEARRLRAATVAGLSVTALSLAVAVYYSLFGFTLRPPQSPQAMITLIALTAIAVTLGALATGLTLLAIDRLLRRFGFSGSAAYGLSAATFAVAAALLGNGLKLATAALATAPAPAFVPVVWGTTDAACHGLLAGLLFWRLTRRQSSAEPYWRDVF